ncbi:MAG: serine/threonine protein kinase [Planctomycetaceae bacterium]|nr:serine/threonine protein kinase [Planctomycetaceae bacterium]
MTAPSPAPPPIPDPDRDPVDVLAEDFAERYRRGETPSISEYVGRYPAHAEQIKNLFPSIALLEQMGSHTPVEGFDATSTFEDQLPPHHQIGDFEIVREIGRGGMGVVYEAVQHSLQRLVALKVLNAGAVHSEQQARRFEREARAAAQLHHTNIVPVFGVGEQDGHRYYVMQRIQGLGLDSVLAELAHMSRNLTPDHTSASSGTSSVSAGELAAVMISGELSNSTSVGVNQRGVSGVGTVQDSSGALQESVLKAPKPGPSRESVSSSLILRDDESQTLGPLSGYVLSDNTDASHILSAASKTASGTHVDIASPSPAARRTGVGRRYWRNVARVGVQIASGLQYAHSQGTLHRDIKPANILLDTDGTAWIADFGLAKVLEAEEVTCSGNILGTLRYMAPEQYQGESDARSDIYSLGLTIYEMLSVSPAYVETNRQQLMARKLTPHELPSLRKRISHLPRDLDTIVLKCVAFEAEERYQSAGALAADLQAFLDDKPIRARQTSAVERLWRWCRRNPVVATLSSALAALLIFTVGLTSAGYVHEQALREAADAERTKAVTERHNAERIADIAFEAFDSLGQSFVSDELAATIQLDEDEQDSDEPATVPAISTETASLLEQVRSAFDQLADVAGTDDRFRDYAAKADLRAGELHLRLNQWSDAEAAFRRGIEMYESTETSPDDPETRLRLAKLYNGLGISTPWHSMHNESREFHTRALTLLEDHLGQSEERFELARTHYLLGRWPFGPGSAGPRTDRDTVRRVMDSRGVSTRGHDHRPETLRPPPDSWRNQGIRGRRPDLGRTADDLQHLRTATDLFTELASESPSTPEYRFWLAQCHLESSRHVPGQTDDNEEQRLEAIALLKELVESYPDKPDYLFRLSEAYGQSYSKWKHFGHKVDDRDAIPTGGIRQEELASQVERDLREALHVSERLIQQQPRVPAYVMSHLYLNMRLAGLLQSQGKVLQAREFFDQVVAFNDSAAKTLPEMDHVFRGMEQVIEFLRVKQLMAEEDFDAARTVLQTILNRYDEDAQRLAQRRGEEKRFPRRALNVYPLLLTCVENLGEEGEADRIRAILAEQEQNNHIRHVGREH